MDIVIGLGMYKAVKDILLKIMHDLDLCYYQNTWLGHGTDYVLMLGNMNARMRAGMVGGIQDYRLLSFIVMQIIVFSCAIRKVFSIETIVWIFLFNMSFGNIAYTWGALMLFTCVRYFQCNYNFEEKMI